MIPCRTFLGHPVDSDHDLSTCLSAAKAKEGIKKWRIKKNGCSGINLPSGIR
jgi:hypothetical protein